MELPASSNFGSIIEEAGYLFMYATMLIGRLAKGFRRKYGKDDEKTRHAYIIKTDLALTAILHLHPRGLMRVELDNILGAKLYIFPDIVNTDWVRFHVTDRMIRERIKKSEIDWLGIDYILSAVSLKGEKSVRIKRDNCVIADFISMLGDAHRRIPRETPEDSIFKDIEKIIARLSQLLRELRDSTTRSREKITADCS